VTAPRDVEPRLKWFHPDHDPSGSGMCAQHTWHALGGSYGNPPAWGCSDANAVIVKVRASGRYRTSGIPPRGAAVYWEYGSNGHAALSNGDGTISTTDPSSGQPTGTPEPLDYPRRWGYTGSADYTLWTDQYNGVRFPVGDEPKPPPPDEEDLMFIFQTYKGPAYLCFADGHAVQLSSGWEATPNAVTVTSPDDATDDRFYNTIIANRR
jgi:hypothetical protein